MSIMSAIENILSEIIGDGFEATASIFIDNEIDVDAFYCLDKDTLVEIRKSTFIIHYSRLTAFFTFHLSPFSLNFKRSD